MIPTGISTGFQNTSEEHFIVQAAESNYSILFWH
jgi:hypothetical protein